MRKILVMTLALAANLSSIAQTDVEMGENFSLSGKSITIFKTENANVAKPSAKFWHLQGVKNDSIATVRFWLKDPKTNEISDSVEWLNNTHVTMRITDKGSKMYMVQDVDSIYLRVIHLQDDVYGIQMYSSPINGTSVALSANIEVLDTVRLEADPLLSRNVGRMELRSKHVVIEIHDDGTVKWWLRNPPHIFVGDRWALTGDRKVTCKTKVGIYKADGQMLAMTDDWKGYPSEHGTVMNMYAKCKMKTFLGNVRNYTILEWLLTTKQFEGAYMRVVSPVYGDYLMDVKFKIPNHWYIKNN